MAGDDYGIFRKPGGGAIFAWLAVAAAIFSGAYSVKMSERLNTANIEIRKACEERDSLKLELARQEGGLQGMRLELERARASVSELTERLGALSARAAQPVVQAMPVVPAAPVEVRSVPAAGQGQETAVVKDSGAQAVPQMIAMPELTDAAATLAVAGGVGNPTLAEAVRLSGEILTYNPDTRKAYLSLGSANAGLEPGKRFSVWRGDKYVTDIRVTRVFSITSTCEVEGATPIGIRSGDIAKLADNQL